MSLMIMMSSWLTKAETMAVINFTTKGIKTKSDLVAKMARLEMNKGGKFQVMDEFDMNERIQSDTNLAGCYGKNCLIALGEKLNVDYVLSGSVEGMMDKIVVTAKLIDVRDKSLKSSHTVEFVQNEEELQRMISIVLTELMGSTADATIKGQLIFKHDVITTANVGRLNNSGPRVGVSYVIPSDLSDFFMRKESQGGLGIQPFMTNIGYQFEAQYIGTENFSALGEVIFNVGGMEQGQFIPSLALLNGFRFGSAGWEIAFGPSLTLRRTSMGLFDESDRYYTATEWEAIKLEEWKNTPTNFDPISGDVLNPFVAPDQSLYSRTLDKRGATNLTANWVMAFGRTFRSGALNIPVNLYYSSNKYGGIVGASVGFNVTKRNRSIN